MCDLEDVCLWATQCTQKDDPWKGGTPCKGYAAYIEQDQVEPNREVTFTGCGCDKAAVSEDQNPFFLSTKKTPRIIFELFFYDHKSATEIAEIVYCSRQYVHRVIKKFQAKKFKKHPNIHHI